MKKNVGSQVIGAQLINASNGTKFTGTAAVDVTVDNGSQTLGTETAPVHKGEGWHTYVPSAAETNGDHIAFTFYDATPNAIPVTVQVYTTFPQTGDAYANQGTPADTDLATDIANLATQATTIDTVVDRIEVDTQDLQTQVGTAGAGLTDLGGMSTAMKAEVQTEANDALVAQKLDHLVAVGDDDAPVDNSIIAQLASTSGDWSTFVASTDSLQSLRDWIGDGTNLSEAGGDGDHLTNIQLGSQTFDNTGTWTGNIVGSIDSLATQAKADVNAEVVDVLSTDTGSLPGQEAPSATAPIATMIAYLYKAWRNKTTQDATTYQVFDDAGTTVDQKATVSDDTTTATVDKVGTGP